MPPRALIFDFDGLIVDTETAIYEAWSELYQSQGEWLALEDYVRCVGSTFGQFDPMAELERRLGRSLDWPPLLETKDHRVLQGHGPLDALPGVRELLKEAAAAGVPCAVASSSSMSWVRTWLEKLQLWEMFQTVRTRDLVEHAKPAPDLFLSAASELELPPSACLVLEDSRNGLLAAHAAGCPCVIIPSVVTRESDFTDACAVLPTLAGVSLRELLNCAIPSEVSRP